MDAILDLLHRFNADLFARTEGPMLFRFFLQPAMAFLAAWHDGRRDAQLGRSPYLAGMLRKGSSNRLQSFREGVTAVTRVLLLGVGMDVIYQFRVFGGFRYPAETFVIAILLALIPYQLMRGIVARIYRRHQTKRVASGNKE